MLFDYFASKIIDELRDSGSLRFKELLHVVKNPRTLSKKLAKLSSASLVEANERGYLLTEKGLKAADLIKKLRDLLESSEVEIMNIERIPHRFYGELLRRYCLILFENYKERLVGVAVFGSIARGDWDSDSDIDLLVVVRGWDEKPVWERMKELIGLRDELRQTDEYRNSLKSGYWPIIQHYPLGVDEAFEFHRIYVDACMDGVVLYERGGFVTGLMKRMRERLIELNAKRLVTPSGNRYWVIPEVKAGEIYQL